MCDYDGWRANIAGEATRHGWFSALQVHTDGYAFVLDIDLGGCRAVRNVDRWFHLPSPPRPAPPVSSRPVDPDDLAAGLKRLRGLAEQMRQAEAGTN